MGVAIDAPDYVTVTFVQKHGGLIVGDVLHTSVGQAHELIRSKLAVIHPDFKIVWQKWERAFAESDARASKAEAERGAALAREAQEAAKYANDARTLARQKTGHPGDVLRSDASIKKEQQIIKARNAKRKG